MNDNVNGTVDSYREEDSFMGFFEGFNRFPVEYEQENPYWMMNTHAYRIGYAGAGSTSYYCPYEMSGSDSRADLNRRSLEYPSMAGEGSFHECAPPLPEESVVPRQPSTSSSEVIWQDEIDPDNMTYEELLDLGEAVGAESKGLPEELISTLPTSKCKIGSFFSKKKTRERCVICQMKYKIGEKQTKLPCKHVYHCECITKWLAINKICPICNNEVFNEESRQ